MQRMDSVGSNRSQASQLEDLEDKRYQRLLAELEKVTSLTGVSPEAVAHLLRRPARAPSPPSSHSSVDTDFNALQVRRDQLEQQLADLEEDNRRMQIDILDRARGTSIPRASNSSTSPKPPTPPHQHQQQPTPPKLDELHALRMECETLRRENTRLKEEVASVVRQHEDTLTKLRKGVAAPDVSEHADERRKRMASIAKQLKAKDGKIASLEGTISAVRSAVSTALELLSKGGDVRPRLEEALRVLDEGSGGKVAVGRMNELMDHLEGFVHSMRHELARGSPHPPAASSCPPSPATPPVPAVQHLDAIPRMLTASPHPPHDVPHDESPDDVLPAVVQCIRKRQERLVEVAGRLQALRREKSQLDAKEAEVKLKREHTVNSINHQRETLLRSIEWWQRKRGEFVASMSEGCSSSEARRLQQYDDMISESTAESAKVADKMRQLIKGVDECAANIKVSRARLEAKEKALDDEVRELTAGLAELKQKEADLLSTLSLSHGRRT
eukprot:Sspe_Gene.90048::Locus_61680_Transcript_2_2_Confidence_0.600_Length_1604::g.90048::m.90048